MSISMKEQTRKLICAVTVNFQNGELPILIVEAGKETVIPEGGHK